MSRLEETIDESANYILDLSEELYRVESGEISVEDSKLNSVISKMMANNFDADAPFNM